ncbi:MAG: (deoxy)nucleoside triphosphate pyrophosphohydrolase [Deferribacterales bacterium]
MKRVDVVAAVLYQDQKFFIAQRPHDRQLGGLWEFPGGKVEEGESHEEALKREMMEEFEAEVSVGDFIAATEHQVEGRLIVLHFYRSELLTDNFKILEHIDSAWCSKEEVKKYNLAPADLDILPFI